MTQSIQITVREARRLALVRAGLLRPRLTGMPTGPGRGERQARAAIDTIIRRFGYLQLDTVSVAGARSHALVLLSRLEGLDPQLPEQLLFPGCNLFEYWGHEASWMPLELYPAFEFRRKALAKHKWVAPVLDAHPELAEAVLERAEEGPFRSQDLEGDGGSGFWEFKVAKRVANALWSSGRLAIEERNKFMRTYNKVETVIPGALRSAPQSVDDALEILLERALAGHGWATLATLADTWRLRNLRPTIHAALGRLEERGTIVRCDLTLKKHRPIPGFLRTADLDVLDAVRSLRCGMTRGVLLSPFDPVLWDRARVALLFGFDQILEIFKPAPQRVYGYYCLPVLAGDRLVSRFDLKAHRRQGRLEIVAAHWEDGVDRSKAEGASKTALERYARAVDLELSPLPS